MDYSLRVAQQPILVRRQEVPVLEIIVGVVAFVVQIGFAWGLNHLWPTHPVLNLFALFVSGSFCCAAAWKLWVAMTGGADDENMSKGFVNIIAVCFYVIIGFSIVALAVMFTFGKAAPTDATVFSIGAGVFALLTAFIAGSIVEHDDTAEDSPWEDSP